MGFLDGLFGKEQPQTPAFRGEQKSARASLKTRGDVASQLGRLLSGVQTELGFDPIGGVLEQRGALPAEARAELARKAGRESADVSGIASEFGTDVAPVGAALSEAGGRLDRGSRDRIRAFESQQQRKDLADFFGRALRGATGVAALDTSAVPEAQRKLSGFDRAVGGATEILGNIFCWVAQRVLADERWLDAREWMLDNLDENQFWLYARFGQETAKNLSNVEVLSLLPLFEAMVHEVRHAPQP